MHHHARTRTALATIALLLVPALAACGSSESTDSGLPAAQGKKSADQGAEKKADPKDIADAQAKYDDCLRKNGMQVDANHSAMGDWDTHLAAEQACKAFKDKLPVQEISPEGEAKARDGLLKMAKCMRDLGYDYPDPGANGSSSTLNLKPGQDATIEKDQQKCGDKAGIGAGLHTASGSSGGQ